MISEEIVIIRGPDGFQIFYFLLFTFYFLLFTLNHR